MKQNGASPALAGLAGLAGWLGCRVSLAGSLWKHGRGPHSKQTGRNVFLEERKRLLGSLRWDNICFGLYGLRSQCCISRFGRFRLYTNFSNKMLNEKNVEDFPGGTDEDDEHGQCQASDVPVPALGQAQRPGTQTTPDSLLFPDPWPSQPCIVLVGASV